MTRAGLIPRDVMEAMEKLKAAGYRVYIVGGAVRDILLGREPSDYDLATTAKPREVLELFEALGWTVVPKGVEYGVVSVVHPESRREIEVATLRREFYPLDYKRRVARVEFTDSIEEDLSRRDFTINAMAMTIDGEVIDPFGGRRDLERGVIRFVGDPLERIREDPLRMLRAVRFAATLPGELEPATFSAIQVRYKAIDEVSRERVGEEIWKAATKAPPGGWARFVELLWGTGLYKAESVLPELGELASTREGYKYGHRGETVLEHTMEVLRRIDEVARPDQALRLAALFHDIAKPRTANPKLDGVFHGHDAIGAEMAREIILNRWRLPWSIAREVSVIVKYHMYPHQAYKSPGMLARLVVRVGSYDTARRVLQLAIADNPTQEEEPILREALARLEEMGRLPKPLVDGYYVMYLYGVEPGPAVGVIKRRLYEIQLRRGVKSRDELIEIACREHGLCPRKARHMRESELNTA